MEDHIIYVAAALIISALILLFSIYRGKSSKKVDSVQDEEPVQRRARHMGVDALPAGGVRNRVAANRNARARMRAAQAQRQPSDSENEEEEDLEDDTNLPQGKVGKKKLAKLQMKAEKKAMREVEERERQEKKEKEEQRIEKIRQKEREEEEEEKKQEEEERLRREEEERKEQEEYEKLKAQFQIEDEGFNQSEDQFKQENLLQDFIQYIKTNKVVLLEDLASKFDLKTQAVIDRVTELQKERVLTGVIDDRGKFIYISRAELESVATFIRQRGRVSIVDLAEMSNTLINLDSPAPAVS